MAYRANPRRDQCLTLRIDPAANVPVTMDGVDAKAPEWPNRLMDADRLRGTCRPIQLDAHIGPRLGFPGNKLLTAAQRA
jgi:hypothetical protein